MIGKYTVGVDVGGTFTDIFVFDETTGKVEINKIPSTRGDQSKGMVEGIRRNVADLSEIGTLIHGTTVATNALLERKGAKAGIITTKGFRDVLEMRRRDRPTTWGLWGSYEPVVDRVDRLEVDERVLADGTVELAVDPEEVKARARELIAAGCESVCIFFINAYANDANERIAAAAVREVWPNPHVSAATEIVPEIREFERVSTAALNAYLQPVVSSYLDRLDAGIREQGFQGNLLIVQSNGGVMSVDTAKRFPVRTALSGPAAGVIAARGIAMNAGFPNVVTGDMGGTSFDVALIENGESSIAAQSSIEFGLVVRTPLIEIKTIGAGGGSIARIDKSGLLQIGPESAGSYPGPVCYGLGNTHPTVTDANVVLGRINADRPIGGKLDRLDVEGARAAIETDIAKPLNISIEEAAEAILKVANSKLAGAIRLVSIEKGHDPADFAIMPFGGGGSLHVGALMQEVGLGAALVPRFPGVTSALGCVIADMRHDRVQTVNTVLDTLDCANLGAELRRVADELAAILDASGVRFERLDRIFELDMLYAGQTHSTTTRLDGDTFTVETLKAAFEGAYAANFRKPLENVSIRVLNYRVAVIGRRPPFDMSVLAPTSAAAVDECRIGTRRLWAGGKAYDAPVYDRLKLEVGSSVAGPALMEQPDTTILIEPGLEGTVDVWGNLLIKRVSA